MSNSDHGTPFDEASSDPVDLWSRTAFDACRSWPLALTGRWFRSDEGYLRLRIEEVDGELLEPLSVIELEISEERILIDFGSWGTPISGYGKAPGWTAEHAVAEARELIEGWTCGDVKLASYRDKSGWRGSKIMEGGSLPDAIDPVPVEIGEGAEVVVKSLRRSGWRSWYRMPDGGWVEREITQA